MGVRTVKLSWTVVELDSESHSWTNCAGINGVNPLRDTPHPSLPQSGEGDEPHPSVGDSVSSTE